MHFEFQKKIDRVSSIMIFNNCKVISVILMAHGSFVRAMCLSDSMKGWFVNMSSIKVSPLVDVWMLFGSCDQRCNLMLVILMLLVHWVKSIYYCTRCYCKWLATALAEELLLSARKRLEEVWMSPPNDSKKNQQEPNRFTNITRTANSKN